MENMTDVVSPCIQKKNLSKAHFFSRKRRIFPDKNLQTTLIKTKNKVKQNPQKTKLTIFL